MRNREEAALAAEATNHNTVGFCQAVTRGWYDAPSVGDFDGDGAADAEDGWKSEPLRARHSTRNPPRGVPVTYLGGSNDNGHRAISLGNGKIRSTDAGGDGNVATVDLDWPEKNFGVTYVGWSETMDGIDIPLPPKPDPVPLAPTRVSAARVLLRAAMKTAIKRKKPARAALIQKMLDVNLKR